jgi:hypothetical protein
MATAPDEVNEDLLQEIVNQVKYSIESPLQIARVVTRKHPAFRAAAKLANKADRERQNRTIRNTVTKAVERIRSFIRPFPNDRCPDCGKKIRTRRCLVCDLEKGLVKETAYE